MKQAGEEKEGETELKEETEKGGRTSHMTLKKYHDTHLRCANKGS